MGEENIYSGAGSSLSPSYGIDEGYGDSFFGNDYRTPTGSFAVTTDPRSANKIKEVSAKLNTGAKTIEIAALQPNLFESIPQQHLEELNRLRKIAGADLTLHGPLIEASGISKEGVDEARRQQAERQMMQVVERANKLDPKGNVLITFHTTSGLPEMMTRNIVEEGGKKESKVTEMYVINERDGSINVVKPKENYLLKEKPDPQKELDKVNEENWFKQLSQVSFHARQGNDVISGLMSNDSEEGGKFGVDPKQVLQGYLDGNKPEFEKFVEAHKDNVQDIDKIINNFNYGEIYARDAYSELQNLYNQAWETLSKDPEKNKDELESLKKYSEKMKPVYESYKVNRANLKDFSEEVVNGVRLLSTLKEQPKVLKPLQDFVIEKSSETFSNVALNAYKKFEDHAPLISLENPPVGMGIGRAEDMVKLIDASRKKLATKLVEDAGLDEDEAKTQAKKLIGATWDVGHINMMKQYGYSDKDILKETEKIAKYVNKIHLSDNFGMEHTELPMGMGNVPIKGHMAKLKEEYGDKLNKMKKIIEAGDWYQHFQTSPFKKTVEAFGSPIYGMQMAPYWNQSPGMNTTTYSGYGMMLPDQHFSMYGSGFSGMPQELGGQIAGRSRLSGNAME